MASTLTDRLSNAVFGGAAIKSPCRVGSTANLTLSGYQTVDGIAIGASDATSSANTRVLVWNQTNSSENGIYEMTSGTWSRTADFDGSRDVLSGTLVWVSTGASQGGGFYSVSNSDPVTPGVSTAISFAQADAFVVTANAASAAAFAACANVAAASAYVAAASAYVAAASAYVAAGSAYVAAGSAVANAASAATFAGSAFVAATSAIANAASAVTAASCAYVAAGSAYVAAGSAYVAAASAYVAAASAYVAAASAYVAAACAYVAAACAAGGPFNSSYQSSGQTITSAGSLSLTHSLGAVPKIVQVILENTSSENGFTAGQQIFVAESAMDNAGSIGVSIIRSSLTLAVRYGSAAACFTHIDATGGGLVNLTNTNWLAIFTAYK